MDRSTNIASLAGAATDLLIAAGRLREHELWDGRSQQRTFIMNNINKAAAELLRWMAENGLTVVASEDEEAA